MCGCMYMGMQFLFEVWAGRLLVKSGRGLQQVPSPGSGVILGKPLTFLGLGLYSLPFSVCTMRAHLGMLL